MRGEVGGWSLPARTVWIGLIREWLGATRRRAFPANWPKARECARGGNVFWQNLIRRGGLAKASRLTSPGTCERTQRISLAGFSIG